MFTRPSLNDAAFKGFDWPSARDKSKWENDSVAATCGIAACQKKFSLTLRKHHCRRCGRVVCDKCSQHKRKLPKNDFPNTAVRVCDLCEDFEMARIRFEEEGLPMLIQGNLFKKHAGGIGKPQMRVVRLTEDKRTLVWHPKDKEPKADHSCPLSLVKEIRKGQTTGAFKRTGSKNHDDVCFSVVATYRTLDLECGGEGEEEGGEEAVKLRDQWATMLQHALLFCRTTSPETLKEEEKTLKDANRLSMHS